MFPVIVNFPHLGRPVDDATLNMIIKPYLERIYELHGDDPRNVSETELQLLRLEVEILGQVGHINPWQLHDRLRQWYFAYLLDFSFF